MHRVATQGCLIWPQAYSGQVRQDAGAEALLPAAWRLEKYLDADDDAGYSLASLRCAACRLVHEGADHNERGSRGQHRTAACPCCVTPAVRAYGTLGVMKVAELLQTRLALFGLHLPGSAGRRGGRLSFFCPCMCILHGVCSPHGCTCSRLCWSCSAAQRGWHGQHRHENLHS